MKNNPQVETKNANVGASPQAENGYTTIANEIMERLAKVKLRPYESCTLWAIFRKTYGWKKKEDKISVTQFQKITGLDRRHQHKALKTLVEKNIIIKKRDSYIVTYGFQKDYTKWKVLPKSAIVTPSKTIAQIGNTLLPKSATELLLKSAPTKETKETIQKKEEKTIFSLKTNLNTTIATAVRQKKGEIGL